MKNPAHPVKREEEEDLGPVTSLLLKRASARSRASACGLRDSRKSASTSTASPRATPRGVEDAADDSAIGEHVIVVVVPFAGRTRSRGALKN
jgi:hypothetical protein